MRLAPKIELLPGPSGARKIPALGGRGKSDEEIPSAFILRPIANLSIRILMYAPSGSVGVQSRNTSAEGAINRMRDRGATF